MRLAPDDAIRLKLLKHLHDRHGTMSEEDTMLMDSGVIRLDRYIGQLLAQGHICRDDARGVYCLTDAGRSELASLEQRGAPTGDDEGSA